MNIDQIISTTPDQEARENIHQQFLKEILILGEREALEFARFRADAAADAAADMLAAETTRTMAAQRKQIIGLMAAIAYISALAFALGIILGRAL
jgi:hypothetical protein